MKSFIFSTVFLLLLASASYAYSTLYTIVLINNGTYCYMSQEGDSPENMHQNAIKEGLVNFEVRVVGKEEYESIMLKQKK